MQHPCNTIAFTLSLLRFKLLNMNIDIESLFEQDEHEATTGRPRIWASPKDMQQGIKKYFNECKSNTKDIATPDGQLIEIPHPLIPTLEGLALMLGVDRKTLHNYSKEEGYENFFHTVKKAKDYILSCKTHHLINGGGCLPGLIFDLKNNHGFADKIEQEIKSENEHSVTVQHDIQIILND